MAEGFFRHKFNNKINEFKKIKEKNVKADINLE